MQVQTCVPRAAGSAAAAPSCRGRRSFRAFASSNGHEAHRTSIHRLVDAEGAIIVPGMSRAEGQPPAPWAAAQRLSGAPCARRSVRCPVRQGSAARGPQGGLRVGRSGEHARGTFGNPRSCSSWRAAPTSRATEGRWTSARRQPGRALAPPSSNCPAPPATRPPLAACPGTGAECRCRATHRCLRHFWESQTSVCSPAQRWRVRLDRSARLSATYQSSPTLTRVRPARPRIGGGGLPWARAASPGRP